MCIVKMSNNSLMFCCEEYNGIIDFFYRINYLFEIKFMLFLKFSYLSKKIKFFVYSRRK